MYVKAVHLGLILRNIMMNNRFAGKKGIPEYWYNITADFPEMYVPSIDPATNKSVTAESLSKIYPESLVEQELNTRDRFIPIPEELLKMYQTWRPTPLVRAYNLEKYLQTKCRIFYKYEGVSPIGSHKANSAVAQAYYCKRAGFKNVVAETGAGQWGSAISMASAFFGLNSTVFMVKNSFDSKPARRIMMQTFGAEVLSSPTNRTSVGRDILQKNPSFQGSLGVAIGEAVESALNDKNTAYSLGSAMNFVCLHQTIIGSELKNQLESLDIKPNYIISCIGGGSSFAGIAFPFLPEKVRRKWDLNFIAVESNAVPSATKGAYTYDYGDSARLTPLSKMYTLGHEFAAPVIHSGGLRYHGLSPLVSKFILDGHATARAYSQLDIYNAAKLFAKCEGYIPAPESAHSIKAAIDVAAEHKNEEKNIIFCLTGHGFFDLAGYEKFNSGNMEDSSSPNESIRESLEKLQKSVGISAYGQETACASAVSGNTGFDSWWDKHFGGQQEERNASFAVSTGQKAVRNDLHNVLTEKKISDALRDNQTEIHVARSCVITPLAQELIKRSGIGIKYE
ncbi:tryptophan synthase beta chain [Ruminiclostridium sufflavum DSM 19573]|uniref:tryptophan synthase n=1 Tax=Ruminiclostridium sufflavum DSM 19573 TaxID=1121337 RepID=A0A318XRV4_9FIRM|nr:tryptophan synthase beta chain [Ruminiclostridium sufflavum DSM 19573]